MPRIKVMKTCAVPVLPTWTQIILLSKVSPLLVSKEHLFYLMALNHKRSDAGNFDRTKRISKVLPLSEKVKVLNLVRKVKIK